MFKFELGQPVMIEPAKIKGLIVGRSEFIDNAVQYLVQTIADGKTAPTRDWVYENILTNDPDGTEVKNKDLELPASA